MTEQLKQAINALQCAKRGHCDHAMADEAIAALEHALTAAQPAQAGEVQQRLFQLLNGAAGDGLIINDIDAAELFTDLFPEHIEFITRGGVGPTQPAAQATRTTADTLREIKAASCKACAATGYTDPGEADSPAGPGRPAIVCGSCNGTGWRDGVHISDQRAAAQATQQAAGEPVGELTATLPDGIGFDVRWLAHSGPTLKVGDRIYTHPAPGVPEGWREVIEKMVKGIDHLAELARQWEPDYSSGADRKGWVLAKNARDEAVDMLAAAQAKGGADA